MEQVKKQRESGIELLRIIAMMGVVVLHYNNAAMGAAFSYVTAGSLNQGILYFLETLCISGVNIYVLISGYFLYRSNNRSVRKIADLFIQVVLFNAAFYVMSIIMGVNTFTLKSCIFNLLPANYFVVLYAVLYLVSPYVNLMLRQLNEETMQNWIYLAVAVFSIWSFVVDVMENAAGFDKIGLSPVGIYGSQEGYTIVNFLLAYMIGAYLNTSKFESGKVTQFRRVLRCAVLLGVVYAFAMVENHFGLASRTAWNYDNPLLLLLAAESFLLFREIHFMSRVINELAKGAFTCFLFHQPLLRFFGVQNVVNGNSLILIGHVILVAVVMYLISYVVYKIYSFVMNMIWNIVGKLGAK